MATTLSRLKEIYRRLDMHSYEALSIHVKRHCGEKLRKGVTEYERELRRYIEVKEIARQSKLPPFRY